MTLLRAFTVALAFALVANNAVAAPPAPKGAPPGYEAKFKAVVEAEKSEEYEKALTLLDEIPQEKHNVYTRLKRASLLVRLGRFTEAEELLSQLLKDPKADPIRDVVKGDLDDLRARMPKLTIRLSAKSKPDAWVTVDDKPVGPPVTVPLNPGTHTVIAKRGDVEVFRQNVTIQDSQTLEVEIDTSIAPPVGNVSATKTSPAPTLTTASAKPVVTETGDKKMGGLPFFIAGGVLAAGSVTSFLLTKSAQSDLEANCTAQRTHTCDTDAAGAGKVRTWQTVGWVTGGLALASIGVGIVFGARSAPESHAATVTPVVGSSTVGFSVAGRF